jgi:polyhydroxyalkanoate synthase subunit PhaC
MAIFDNPKRLGTIPKTANEIAMVTIQDFLSQMLSMSKQGESVTPMMAIDPAILVTLQQEYLARVQEIISGNTAATSNDKRFSSASWQSQPWSNTAALYALNREFMLKMIDSVEMSASGAAGTSNPKAMEQASNRMKFFAEQALDAMSPSNFLATNPEAQEHIRATSGKSLQEGLTNLMGDLQRGRMLQTDETKFEVGKNLAVTPGKVVFRNELMELICYTPSTKKVFERPLLMVPPCINKFYILDLQPENSLVQYLVSQGHQVFMVSWRNILEEQGHLTWDDYLESGVHAAIAKVQAISKQETINALGFCVGGTLLSAGVAALAANDEHPIESLTLLTTLLDFSNPGILGLFIDEQHCAMRDATLANGGVMQGKELATTFSFLRPNDLVWNYVVNNYLKGETPPAFDLLYWNADSTNLPGPMFTWYLRHMYLENELRIPGKLAGAGAPIDLNAITCPAFVYGSKEDHIVPWEAAYEGTRLLGGATEFVLGASGHIAGVINPAVKNKRNFWRTPVESTTKKKSAKRKTSEKPPAGEWLASAQTVPGSWWGHWNEWLSQFAGATIDAKLISSTKAKSLGAAPGDYVKQRV